MNGFDQRIQGKPEARDVPQRELFGPERQSWEVEVPLLTFPGDPLQAGLGILRFISTQLLSTYYVPGPDQGESCPHREIFNQRLSQMSIQFNCEKWEGGVWEMRASSRDFADVWKGE